MHFRRPSRYINREINAVRKDAFLRVALAFPDIYEVGMSHLGLKILYDIINGIPYACCERAFHPWLDMDEAIRESRTPLTSVESKTPLWGFDVVGFSLQYELSYSSVLNMLSLGGIPLRTAMRDASHPLIIAGGPCTVNPLPMSPFIDAFLVGDGEEAVKEIVEAVFIWKTEGDAKRQSVLEALSKIEGVYVPSVHKAGVTTVRRRVISSLDEAPYPLAPIVPYTQVVHDRINIEVSRGCTMGCRFCQAGMIYRPLRERTPEKVLQTAAESIKNTGYEEVALTSLSAGDYPALLPLIKEFNRRFRMVSISLPSLRVRAVNRDILKEIKSVRKTGFTIAPEAATDRLRCVINKDFSEDDYDRALDALFSKGWHNLKLYFMMGLPTETDEDIEAIPGMVLRALKTAKKHTSRFVNLSVSVSPFIPKPHTPFQWLGQTDMKDIRRKKDYLRGALKKINIKDHDEDMSMLEAAFARGDERLSELLEAAYREGAKLDGWTESFNFENWLRAMEKTGIDAAGYAKRKFETKDSLPWDVIETGIKKEFLLEELDRAYSAALTEDCRHACTGCGLQCEEKDKAGTLKPFLEGLSKKGLWPFRKPIRVRARFSKTGTLCYLSHRELMTHIARALRRADVMLEYSKGFHPSPKLAFGPPLGVGVSGLREYFDMEMLPGIPLGTLKDRVNSKLAPGIEVHEIAPVGFDEPSLQDFISRYEYEIKVVQHPSSETGRRLQMHMENGSYDPASFLEKDEVLAKRRDGYVNIRPMIEEVGTTGGKVRLTVRDLRDKKVRLDEILWALFDVPASELEITRLFMYGFKRKWSLPLEVKGKWPVAY